MRQLRPILLAVATIAIALVAADAARAHSSYKQSNPVAATRVEQAPDSVRIEFSQPFNPELTKIELFEATTGLRYAVRVSVPEPGVAVVHPEGGSLANGAYRIRWHTVGGYDGHVLEGTFGFGLGAAPPVDAEPTITSSPFRGWGTLRVTSRAVMLITLFFFAGGVLVPVLLRIRGSHAAWLLPTNERDLEHGDFLRRLERRTVRAGWLAFGSGAVAALVETIDAGGIPTSGVVGAFLLTNVSGLSRIVMLALLLAGTILLTRRLRLAAACVSLAFLAMAFGGHAYMPSFRLVALTTDWLHLVAAAVWAGGIAQLALAWVPQIFGRSGGLRRAVMREVLNGFGKVAMPAFVVVAVTGSVHALIRLGRVPALWETTYGRVLFVKVLLIGLIATASYLHAMRLRPRILATIRPQLGLERHHWRLIGSEPVLIVAAIAAVAVLVAYPLPPRDSRTQSAEPAERATLVNANSTPDRAAGQP